MPNPEIPDDYCLTYTAIGRSYFTAEQSNLAKELATLLAVQGWTLRTRAIHGLDKVFWKEHHSISLKAELYTTWNVTRESLKFADRIRRKVQGRNTRWDFRRRKIHWYTPYYHRSVARSCQALLGNNLDSPSDLLIILGKGRYKKSGKKEEGRISTDIVEVMAHHLAIENCMGIVNLRTRSGRDYARQVIDALRQS